MEKLNIRLLKLVIATIFVAFSGSAFAGPYRMSSKAPVIPVSQPKGYFFGYGGWDSGADWETHGAFDGDYRDHCPPGYEGHYGFDPNKIPIDFDLNSGWTAGGGVGFYSSLFNGSRFEIEGSYTSNDNGNLTYANFELPADFTIETIAVMFNFLKEVPLGETGATGYFGPGVGWHTTEFRGDIDTIKYSDRDSGFAWQLIAGVDFPLTERLALFTQYRFLVLDSELTHETDFGDFRQTTTSSPYSHAVMVGARVSF